MESLYFYCAAAAGGLLLAQSALSLLGMGHGADLHDDAPDLHLDHADTELSDGDVDHSGAWFVGVLSLRAICSAIMMFGLAGMSAKDIYNPQVSFAIALGCGVAVLFGVAYLLRTLYNFANDGTVHIEETLGQTGSVYLTIPGHNTGKGKVTVLVQGRTMEYEASTDGDTLHTGTPILVVDVPTQDLVQVSRDETPSPLGTSHA